MEFNWVKALHECSIRAVFKRLETGVEADLDAIREVAKSLKAVDTFEVASYEDRFAVIRKKEGGVLAVDFHISGGEIIASMNGKTVRAVPTLNTEGHCVLLVDSEELEPWQFRRRTLMDLLFVNL